jgi:hypothetical protein
MARNRGFSSGLTGPVSISSPEVALIAVVGGFVARKGGVRGEFFKKNGRAGIF